MLANAEIIHHHTDDGGSAGGSGDKICISAGDSEPIDGPPICEFVARRSANKQIGSSSSAGAASKRTTFHRSTRTDRERSFAQLGAESAKTLGKSLLAQFEIVAFLSIQVSNYLLARAYLPQLIFIGRSSVERNHFNGREILINSSSTSTLNGQHRRVYCSLNYFGDGCTTFCRPRDDQFGHYNCSATGQKVCLEGWTGGECDKAKCRAGCNHQHGYCDKPDTCQCRSGWTGSRCDECITYPGCQNGYCLSSWQCICHRNWGGVLCDRDLNFCGTHEPCKNNGTCLNVAPGKYKCQCPSGFGGVDCEISLTSLTATLGSLTQLSAGCALNPCLNGGTCYGFTSQLIDASPTAVEWAASVENAPANSPLMMDRLYRCQCLPGWTGDYCQWAEALPITGLLPAPMNDSTQAANRTSASISATEDDRSPEGSQVVDVPVTTSDSFLPPLTTVGTETQLSVGSLDMRRLISGVVVASVIGVFLAVLLLAWLCLVWIERSKFSLIQMNIIRSGADGENGEHHHIVTATLRRMGSKIRDSFRRSSRMIPDSKLNIENVLRPPKPPPSYEESSHYNAVNRIAMEYPPIIMPKNKQTPSPPSSSSSSSDEGANCDQKRTIEQADDESLVKRGALAQKLATIQTSKDYYSKSSPQQQPVNKTSDDNQDYQHISSIQIQCPKHGHLHRQQVTNHERSPPHVEYYVDRADLEQIDHYKKSNYH